jgi:hypothetical protein
MMYALPIPENLAIQLGALHTLTGRNVGQSTTFTGGFTYAFRF